ncbi:MAG: hypothetical protein WC520_02545 [Candidatus Paceibacterota bacterium]
MIISRPKNTKSKGFVEFFVYKEKDAFIGVCLTFDIVEEGKDPKKLMDSLHEAALLHIKTVIDKNLSDDLLNRYAPVEYWKKYFSLMDSLRKARLQKQRLENSMQQMCKYDESIFSMNELANC